MYQRSAVILEKYFAEKFYYRDRSSIKNNYENYLRLVDILEKYQEISEEEDKIINECEDIATKIKQIQKSQSSLYKRNLKLEEDRSSLFESIDEAAIDLAKQLERIEKEIDENNDQMKPIGKEFVAAIDSFNETSQNRAEYGRKRRKVEKEYTSILDKTINNINEIEPETVAEIKKFIAEDNTKSSEELKRMMLKNGEKEKIPFDIDVIESSIAFGHEIYKQEAKLLVEIYEKTSSLINETNNSVVKINKYKKLAKNVKNKLLFIGTQKEYLTQFLDNERLSVNLGTHEHKKLMKEACNDFNNDVAQIRNLNDILLKEIANKATQKMYSSAYSADYLADLKKKETEFENKLDELNLVGQILNPIYWRISSIEKIYTVFDNIVTEEYGRDLSKFKIEEVKEEVEEDNTEGFMDYYDNMDSDEEDSNEVDNNDDDDENIENIGIDDDEYDEEETDNEDDDEDEIDEEDDNDEDYEDEDEDDEEEDYDDDDDDDDDDDYDDDDEDEYEEEKDSDIDDDDYDDEDDEIDYDEDDDDDEYDEYDEDDEEEEDDDDEDDDEEDHDEDDDEDDEDDDEDDYEDEIDDDEYDDLDVILQNRKKILGRGAGKKAKAPKKRNDSKPKRKGLFGLGTKK